MSNQDRQPARILFVSASVGAGHNSASRALMQGLAESGADVVCPWIDAIAAGKRYFRAYYAGGFEVLMTRLPWLYGAGFRWSDRRAGAGYTRMERLRHWWERLALRALERQIEEIQPDLVVNTHFLSTPLVGRLRRQGRLRCPQVVVVTDHMVHRWWYALDVDHWFLPSEAGLEPLERWGVEPQRITVSGIPIHPKWTREVDHQRVLSEWRLPADKTIVLLSGGAAFTVGPIHEMARQLVETCPGIHLVVLAGRNKKLLADLTTLSDYVGGVTAIGYTDRLHELGAVADLMITKAGGITTSECLTSQTPMLLYRPVPGQEAGNAELLAAEGAAVIVRRDDEVAPTVRDLLETPRRLEELAANCRRLARNGTGTIVQNVLRMVDRQPGQAPVGHCAID